MDISLNIVELIENNPITKLSSTYNGKLLTKIQDNFTKFEQQLFVTSFYCYLNCDEKNDFVVDLDNVWKWLGFSVKIKAKTLLEKHFIIDKDYKILLCDSVKQYENEKKHGGYNKETIMLSVKTFKLFCIKTDTKKADKIHEYYLKMEDIIHQVVQEESDELKKQLENVNAKLECQIIQTEKEKVKLREKTILEQFPSNTQCVYYGLIDNISDKNEALIKFGNSNHLRNRVTKHRDTYDNFRLTNAFKVSNQLEIETAIKNDPILGNMMRTITIKNKKYIELLSIEDITLCELDNMIQEIIKSIECTPDNYKKIIEENKVIKQKLFEKGNEDNSNRVIALTIENKRLTRENEMLTKKLKKHDKVVAFWRATLIEKGVNVTFDDVTFEKSEQNFVPFFQKGDDEEQIDYNAFDYEDSQILGKPIKQNNGSYVLGTHVYDILVGKRQQVWDGVAYKTSGGLIKQDLIVNTSGKVVSLRKCIHETNHNKFYKINILKAKKN